MEKIAYELRLSDCLIPVKGIVNYVRRNKDTAIRNEQLVTMDYDFGNDLRNFGLAACQTFLIPASIILAANGVAKGIEFLLR